MYVNYMSVYGYLRVSTNEQNLNNQKFEILKYCKLNNIRGIEFIDEKISGMKSINNRKLGVLLENLKQNDILIITELSRLGRTIRSIQNSINIILDKKVKCICV